MLCPRFVIPAPHGAKAAAKASPAMVIIFSCLTFLGKSRKMVVLFCPGAAESFLSRFVTGGCGGTDSPLPRGIVPNSSASRSEPGRGGRGAAGATPLLPSRCRRSGGGRVRADALPCARRTPLCPASCRHGFGVRGKCTERPGQTQPSPPLAKPQRLQMERDREEEERVRGRGGGGEGASQLPPAAAGKAARPQCDAGSACFPPPLALIAASRPPAPLPGRGSCARPAPRHYRPRADLEGLRLLGFFFFF